VEDVQVRNPPTSNPSQSLSYFLSQVALKFASGHYLRVAMKSFGHNQIGRSTTPNSLLIHMAKFTDI
jgi:hypothetical protein